MEQIDFAFDDKKYFIFNKQVATTWLKNGDSICVLQTGRHYVAKNDVINRFQQIDRQYVANYSSSVKSARLRRSFLLVEVKAYLKDKAP